MSDKELIKSAFEAKNIKLVKVLFDNSNLDELFKRGYSWSCALSEIGVFNNSLSFNFTIDYLYKKKRLDIVKRFFGNSSKLCEASAFLNGKNFRRLRKITHKNWWALKGDGCLKESIRCNNLFMVKTLIQLYKNYNYDLNFVLPTLSYVIERNFEDEFQSKNQDFRVLKLLNKECERISHILVNYVLNSRNEDLIKLKLKRIKGIFKLKGLNYQEGCISKFLNNKDLFFYLYNNTAKTQRSNFFGLGYYSNIFSLLERGIRENYGRINKEVALFLLKNNLKIISKTNQ